MKNECKSDIYKLYTANCLNKMQELILLRRSKMTQTEMAKQAGVSLKTIQRFENYEINPYLIFAYKTILQ
jgi:DNA-binding XRE family transcriptional regulator